MSKRWIYLTDMSGSGATIYNPETDTIRHIGIAAVAGKAPGGLRRMVLEENGTGFVETGEMVPLNEQLIDELEDSYNTSRNNWNYDWPHLQVEMGDTPEKQEFVRQRLTEMMSAYPYKFEIVGLQRRFLMYFSDGNFKSQQKFVALVPTPHANPFRRDGSLRRRYRGNWSNLDRDAGAPYPKKYEQEVGGGLRPLLYVGPAYVVKFQLDGQTVAFENCNVYVDDEANFICSDWCQRHDHSSYENGINLQTMIYDFASWVTGPCVGRAVKQGVFKPTSAKFEQFAVRDLIRRGSITTISIEEAQVQARAQLEKTVKDRLELEISSAVTNAPVTMTDEQIVDSLVVKLLQAHEKNDCGLLRGQPMLMRKKLLTAEQQAIMPETAKIGDLSYRVTSNAVCPVGQSVTDAVLCVSNGEFHMHTYPASVTLDLAPMNARLLSRVRLLRADVLLRGEERASDLSPITADILAEAEAAFAAQQQARQLDRRVDLMNGVLRTLEGRGPVQYEFDGVGTAQVTPHDDESVTLEWISGKYATPDTCRRYRRKAEGVYETRKEYARAMPFQPVTAGSAAHKVITWYFEEYAPTRRDLTSLAPIKVAASEAAPSSNPSSFNPDDYEFDFLLGGQQWRAKSGEPLDGDSTVYIWTLPTETPFRVVRRANGHLYAVNDGGESVTAPKSVRDAAKKAFGTIDAALAVGVL